jgi:hypothetical protein
MDPVPVNKIRNIAADLLIKPPKYLFFLIFPGFSLQPENFSFSMNVTEKKINGAVRGFSNSV